MSDGNPPSAKRAPTLYAIITFKLLKGLLFVVLAVVLYCLSDNNLPEEYRNFLSQPPVQKILHALRVHPGNKFFSDLALKIGELTEVNVLWAAAGVRHLFSVGFRYVVFQVNYAGAWDAASFAELGRQYRAMAELYVEMTRREEKFYLSPFDVKLATHIRGKAVLVGLFKR